MGWIIAGTVYGVGAIASGIFSYFMMGMGPLETGEKVKSSLIFGALWPILGTMFVLTGLYHRFKG